MGSVLNTYTLNKTSQKSIFASLKLIGESVGTLRSCAIVIEFVNSELFSSRLLILTTPTCALSSGSTTFNKFPACGKHWTIHTHCPQADFSNIGNVTGIQKTDSFSNHTVPPLTLDQTQSFHVCLSHWQAIQTAGLRFNSTFCNCYLLHSILLTK